MYLISAYFDEKTEKRLREYMKVLAERSGNGYMYDKNVPPHITVSAFSCSDEMKVCEAFKKTAASFEAGKIILASAGAFFPGVMYVAPVLNEYLQNISELVYGNINSIEDISVSRYYRPFQWQPHITVAGKLSPSEMTAAFSAIQDIFRMSEGRIIRLGLAEKRPYREIGFT